MTEVTQIKLVFECKDPVLAAYYEEKFGYRFRSDLAYYAMGSADTGTWENLMIKWNTEMAAEAVFQEHYDYDVIDGVRVLQKFVKEPASEVMVPKLLIPTIRVEPVTQEVTVP